MSEQRIPFPDYPASEQRRDFERFERLQQKEVYIMRVNGVWNAYLPRKKHPLSIPAERGEELAEFIKSLQEEFKELKIKPRFRCIRNKGVEDFIKQQLILHNLLRNS